jgi:uncharacterized membrane protein YbaN (DUF454 family)
VTSAERSKWTDNILIKFDPGLTMQETLLAELRLAVDTWPLAVPLPISAADEPPALIDVSNPSYALEASSPAQPDGYYVTGLRRHVYQILGWASVGMAAVGFALPGIPGAPFVVLAGYFFIRSSPKAHAWLLQSRWFGPILRDWDQHRGIRRSLKYTAVGLIVVAMAVVLLLGLPAALVATILVLEVIGLFIVLQIPVVEPTPPAALITP